MRDFRFHDLCNTAASWNAGRQLHGDHYLTRELKDRPTDVTRQPNPFNRQELLLKAHLLRLRHVSKWPTLRLFSSNNSIVCKTRTIFSSPPAESCIARPDLLLWLAAFGAWVVFAFSVAYELRAVEIDLTQVSSGVTRGFVIEVA